MAGLVELPRAGHGWVLSDGTRAPIWFLLLTWPVLPALVALWAVRRLLR